MRPNDTFIGQPVRSLQTMLRVIAEDDRKYPTVIPDGIYGPETMRAVGTFQRQNRLPVTGVADQVTWESIVDTYNDAIIRIGQAESIEILIDPGQVFYPGDSNPYIYLLQSMLTQLSLDHPSINTPDHSGMMDPSTVQALAAFQKLAGLNADGNLDKITWKHLVYQFTLNAHHNTAHQKEY